ncbi:uncharacterized protein LOC108034490 [Drosophila biarmipes]|uniref:uncharacterized protein LOC108034490 n=1 Tax=Drosophila biarmipes TaxID=125945 RepID=UPI0007E84161|nr:uncharacterized protein LOC108034490 [Drosophila biarmipes]
MTRNFLLENRMMVSQTSRNYQLPTVASRARCHGPAKLGLTTIQRGLTVGKALPSKTTSRQKLSEKQIQTEDISDERFLSAALLKCSEKSPSPSQTHLSSRSEGDEGGLFLGEGLGVRRTASNYELGRMPERDAYQPGQYTLHRPLANAFGILPSGLNHLDTSCSSNTKSDEEASSRISSPRCRQMDIPEVVDVDPQDVLSLHSQSSCEELHSKKTQPQEVEVQAQEDHQKELEKQSEPHLILLSSEQRRELLEAAQERQRQLISEYNRLPLSMGTLRVRNLKKKLERELDAVDHDLSMLLQAKVYLKQENNCESICLSKNVDKNRWLNKI